MRVVRKNEKAQRLRIILSIVFAVGLTTVYLLLMVMRGQ
jgi:hypothetical protein